MGVPTTQHVSSFLVANRMPDYGVCLNDRTRSEESCAEAPCRLVAPLSAEIPESLSQSKIDRLFHAFSRLPMSLTPDEQRTIADHLRSRSQSPKCPVCEASNMVVREEVTLHPIDQDGDSSLPMANVMCKYCGYVLQFSLSAVGIPVD